jgi:hypothetical protein
MNTLILLIAAAVMIGAAIFLGQEAMKLRKINKMLAGVVKALHDNPPHKEEDKQ